MLVVLRANVTYVGVTMNLSLDIILEGSVVVSK